MRKYQLTLSASFLVKVTLFYRIGEQNTKILALQKSSPLLAYTPTTRNVFLQIFLKKMLI